MLPRNFPKKNYPKHPRQKLPGDVVFAHKGKKGDRMPLEHSEILRPSSGSKPPDQ